MAHIMDAPWEYDVAPFAITDNVWYVGNAQVSSHLIDTGDGLVLIDTGWPGTLYLLLESIRQTGHDPANIKLIIHSHYHIDHIGGTKQLVHKYGCETLLGKQDLLLTGDRLDLSLCAFHDSMWVTGFDITHAVGEEDTLTIGNTTFRFREAPGHTPGTLGIFFPSTINGQSVRCGMHGGIGRNTLESKFLRQYNLDPGVREIYRQSMLRMREETVDVPLANHPAHQQLLERKAAAKPGENPFYDPQLWVKHIDEQLEKYEALLQRDPV